MAGDFIAKGINIGALDEEKKWPVKMLVKDGDEVKGGQVFATTGESGMIEHRSMVPPGARGVVSGVVPTASTPSRSRSPMWTWAAAARSP